MWAKHAQGTVIRQAQGAWPQGTYEEHHARDGFAGDCSQLYRAHPTTEWTRVEGPIRPRGILTDDLPAEDDADERAQPTTLLECADMRLSISRRRRPAPYLFRNADGDTVILVQRGSGLLVCDYGTLEYGPLEYLVIPKGTNYRLIPHTTDNLSYVVETTAAVGVPDRGLLGHFLPFDIGVLDVPRLDALRAHGSGLDGPEWEIVVKRGERLSSIFHPFDPLDVEGWQGSVTPYRLRLRDIRPVTSERMDVPPITHATFAAEGVWFCTMAPRIWQNDPEAAHVQPYHRNVDYDEIIINLGSPEGDGVPGRPIGLMTVTPGGMNHGPGAAMLRHPMERMPFYLLNIDTRQALRPTSAFEQAEIPDFYERQRFSGPGR
ncbi:homogentisate 1,2-dioxygenase [Actinomadura rugatobispora]|uniref:Homogentisate 1,2-dioxygenase n=1 Tax=Actinomadura rugatobispora TaxID=1994 RepID=A0ABW0ZX12_9ACTN|nr:homogentisate 1,2-dioxygenase [Actinomadura rugatobispora]